MCFGSWDLAREGMGNRREQAVPVRDGGPQPSSVGHIWVRFQKCLFPAAESPRGLDAGFCVWFNNNWIGKQLSCQRIKPVHTQAL